MLFGRGRKGRLLEQPIRGGATTTTTSAQHVAPIFTSVHPLVLTGSPRFFPRMASGSSSTNQLSLFLLETARLLAAFLRSAVRRLHKVSKCFQMGGAHACMRAMQSWLMLQVRTFCVCTTGWEERFGFMMERKRVKFWSF